jgi:hypothetical protein
MKTKQAARFSPHARSHHPFPSISIDGEGFGACPHLEIQIWAAAEVASEAIPHNFSKQTSKVKQAARFSSPSRSRHPSSSISIDGEGFGACPHPESWIWAAAEVAGGAVPHNSSQQTSKNKQAARFSPRARSLHPSPSVSIDREGLGACPHPESRIWAAVAVAGGAAASCR